VDSDIQDLVNKTGVAMPLVSGIVRLIMSSGASHVEARAAMAAVEAFLPILPISYRSETLHDAP
jgi:hypothetical protein